MFNSFEIRISFRTRPPLEQISTASICSTETGNVASQKKRKKEEKPKRQKYNILRSECAISYAL